MQKRCDEDLAFMLRYENVAWYDDGAVKILDRRVYPFKIEYALCKSYKDVAKAIADMVTQSAGPYTAAGMGMALACYECRDMAKDKMKAYLEEASCALSHARPTTRERMEQITKNALKTALSAIDKGERADEAVFMDTVESLNRRYTIMESVAEYLADMFPKNGRIMTQCFGETIVGMMLRVAKRRGNNIRLFVPETRPYFQGSRLTASVAADQGFDTTVITDNMPAFVMKHIGIDLFTSAADVICLDGHITNKIGTYQLAVTAKYHGVPYFVTGIPDKNCKNFKNIVIEERNPQDVLSAAGVKITAEGVKGYYPAFDITPPHLISAIVTDKGIYAPYDLKRYFETPIERFY